MKDGHMGVALLLKFERTVNAIGRPELLEDERFNSMAAQVIHIDAFLEIIGEWAQDVTVAEAAAIFEAYDIPYAKVNSNREILNSQVVEDRRMLVDVHLPGVGQVPVINTPFKFSAVPTGPAGSPPDLGQDNHAVLKDLAGFSDAEIEDMEQSGIIKRM
jgi:crotonobetainyl-CoA:carnitine CoA-transferase CaiB-like acyl-CoA transferase